ncbi:hypothetical protein LguiA_035796 [Lonicera macranthoides]
MANQMEQEMKQDLINRRRSPRLNIPKSKVDPAVVNTIPKPEIHREEESSDKKGTKRARPAAHCKSRAAAMVQIDGEAAIVTTDQFRSNMISFARSLVLFKAGGLESVHVNSMMNTPFYALFDMYNQGLVQTTKHRKSDLDIIRIIRCYHAPTGTFVFGGKHVKLTPTWVTKIFGVPCLGDRIDISEPDEAEDEDKPLFVRWDVRKLKKAFQQADGKPVIEKYVIDVDNIGAASNVSDIDIEVRKRSRAPRAMASIPVVQGTESSKCKGFDIRDSKPSEPKEEVNDGAKDMFNGKGETDNVKGSESVPTFFDVNFSKYSVGSSDSAQKLSKAAVTDNVNAVRDEAVVRPELDEQTAPQPRYGNPPSGCTPSNHSGTTEFPKKTSGKEDGATINPSRTEVPNVNVGSSRRNAGPSFTNRGSHVFVPSVPPKLSISRDMIDQLISGVDDNATTEFKKLMVAHEHLTDNYMKSIEELKRRDIEINELKARCNNLEDTANEMAVRLKSNEGHLERSETRVGMLLCLLDESRTAASELEKRCSSLDVADTVHSIIKSRSKGKKETETVENSGLPSFNLHVSQVASTKKGAASNSSGVETDERLMELEVENEKLKVAIEVLQHTNYDMMTQKDGEILSWVDNNNRLEEEAERWCRGVDNAKGEADHLRTVFERKRKDFDELVVFNKKHMDKLVEVQSVNDELTIINRTLQSELKKNEPSVPVPKLEPEQGSIARGVVERGLRGKAAAQVDGKQCTDRKRKDIGVTEYASLNDHHTRRTRRSVSAVIHRATVPGDGDKSNPVNIDDCTEDTNKPRSRRPLKQFNVNKTSIAKHLESGTKIKLQTILTDKSPGYELILLDIVSLSVKDMVDILDNNSLSSNVIDTYAKLLKTGAAVDRGCNVNPTILTTFAWQYVLLGREIGINKFLLDPILENIHRSTHIMIPLHHEEKYHFTMMYLDKEKGVWYHVNPMKPRKKGDEFNKCYRDASRMHSEIRRFLLQMKDNAANTLVEGTRDHFSTKDDGKSKHKQVLSDTERDALQWLASSAVDYPLEAKTDCPHQSNDSVDCAVAVMYYMTELYAGRELDGSLRSSVIRDMRVRVAKVFTASMLELLNTDQTKDKSSMDGAPEEMNG